MPKAKWNYIKQYHLKQASRSQRNTAFSARHFHICLAWGAHNHSWPSFSRNLAKTNKQERKSTEDIDGLKVRETWLWRSHSWFQTCDIITGGGEVTGFHMLLPNYPLLSLNKLLQLSSLVANRLWIYHITTRGCVWHFWHVHTKIYIHTH